MFSYNLKLKNFFPIAEEVKIISIQHESKIDLSKYKKTKSK